MEWRSTYVRMKLMAPMMEKAIAPMTEKAMMENPARYIYKFMKFHDH
jgi:hypothetical protein